MMSQKQFTLFLMVLVCGLMIEGLKRLNGFSSNRSEKMATLSMRDLDAKPYYVSQADRVERKSERHDRAGRGGFRLSGQRNAKVLNQLETPQPRKIADLKGLPKIADDKTKKDKKKKKKKKSGRGKKEVKKTDEDTSIAKDSKEDESKTRNSGIGSGQTQPPTQFAGTPPRPNTLPVTYEDWAKLILGSPRPENVTKLVEFYSNNMVSGEIFYSLLNAMLEESDPRQHTLAVFAAGNVPNAQSFSFLVHVLKTDPQGSVAFNKAEEQIAAYQTLHNVVHLKAVLSVHIADSTIVQLAVATLDKSTQSYLEERKPAEEDEEEREPQAEDPTKGTDQKKTPVNTKVYQGFEPLLESVISAFKDQRSITEPAERALARIKKLPVVVADTNG